MLRNLTHWGLCIATILALSVAALFPIALWMPSQLAAYVSDAMHLPAGILLFFILRFLSQKWPFLRRQTLWILLVSLGIIVAVEMIQPYFQRERSANDVVVGLIGVLLGIGFSQGRRLLQTLMGLCFVCVSLYLGYPIYSVLMAMQWQNSHFPIIADFRQPRLAPFIESASVNQLRYQANTLGLVPYYLRLTPDAKVAWPGINLYLNHQDWRAYQNLCFTARSDKATELLLRLDDVDSVNHATRYTRALPISEAWQTHCLTLSELKTPSGRGLHLNDMTHLILFLHTGTDVAFVDYAKIELR